MNGDATTPDGKPGLSTLRGLDYIKEEEVAGWERMFYEFELCPCEQLFRETSNPLYVWEAIRRLGRLRQSSPYMVLPLWCMDYLSQSAKQIEELKELGPTKALSRFRGALGLSVRGGNYFASLRKVEEQKKLAQAEALYRKEMTAAQAKYMLGLEKAMAASPGVKARLAKDGESAIGPRTIEVYVAKGKRYSKLSRKPE